MLSNDDVIVRRGIEEFKRLKEYLKKEGYSEEELERLRRCFENDIFVTIPFNCKIGGVKAYIRVHIEPDPHGDGKGTDAHFHTAIDCPKIKVVVDSPEPDRCSVTDKTCPFVQPLGGIERDEKLRKKYYAGEIILAVTSIEQYSKKILLDYFKSNNIKISVNKVKKFRLADVTMFLYALKLIDYETYLDLNKIREIRNDLAHDPEAYLKFKEKELYEALLLAYECVEKLKQLNPSKC